MRNKQNLILALMLGIIFSFSFILLAEEVSATSISITSALNASLEQAVLSGGNFTLNVTSSNESNAQQPNGGWAANVSVFRLCERETTPTVIASRLNTSTNQSTFSFGINTTQFDDCNMTLIVRASNQTSGATLLRPGGETNVTSAYINNSVLIVSPVNSNYEVQKSSNGSITYTINTDEQAANATFIINGKLATMTRTNSSGMQWQGSVTDLPTGTYTITIQSRDLANDLITTVRNVQVSSLGADGIGTLVNVGVIGTNGVSGSSTSSAANLAFLSNTVNIGGRQVSVMAIIIVLVLIYFFFLRGK